MSDFKERLWDDLVRQHGTSLANVSRPARSRLRRAPRRLLAGTTLVLAAAGTVTGLVLGASSSPAFAVSRHRDGTVEVTIRAVGGISGANARLAQFGIHARAVQVAPGCPAQLPPGVLHRAIGGLVHMGAARGQVHVSVTARFDPRRIPPGRTLVVPVVPAWRAGGRVQVVPGQVVRGRAPACLPFAPPPVALRPGMGPPGLGRGIECLPGPGHATRRGGLPPLPALPRQVRPRR